ncbi:MAG: methyltransferase domain-containing protein [Elusimicrobiota bacterium]
MTRLLCRYDAVWGAIRKVNLCGGGQKIPGYVSVDISPSADMQIDLSRYDLPFMDDSLDVVVCISAINYFTRRRASEIVGQVHRALKKGGVARFAVQDLESIAKRYVEKDNPFFFQKLPDGTERFEGPTLGDKFVAWFYGYAIGSHRCQYFYDFDALAHLFTQAGFSNVKRRNYQESLIQDIALIDNRPDQMFFLEAVK